ncbi:MAG: hypothetical protein Q8O53_01600 [Candidatus Moranbacteria bacterium]|nr:hypothetical protein [Candidatus Moranbacteria bacterium]
MKGDFKMTKKTGPVKIRITKTPEYVCHKKEKHHHEYLKALVGLELLAIRCPTNPKVMLASSMDVITALHKAGRILGLTYWRWLWNETNGLHQSYVFQEGHYVVLRQRKKKNFLP